MAFQEYTLLDLRDGLKQEFGLDDGQDSNVTRKINDARKWIIRKRNGLWPWQIRDLVIDVAPSRNGTATFTQGSSAVTWLTLDKPIDPLVSTAREILSVGSSTKTITEGFLVTDFTDPAITIDANFVGANSVGQAFTVVNGYYQLPSDFQRLRSFYDVSLVAGRSIKRTQLQFEELRRNQAIAVGTNTVYAIGKDPLGEGHADYSNNLFIAIYPYPGSRSTFRGKYVVDVQDLVADADVCIMPRNHREVIFWVAAWQIALKYKESAQIQTYKEIADEALKDMLAEHDLAVDRSEDMSPFRTNIGPVRPPPGFPEWRLP